MKKILIGVSLLLLCAVSTFAKEPKKMIRMNLELGSEFYRAPKYESVGASTYAIWVEEHYTNKSPRQFHGVSYSAIRYLIDCRNSKFRRTTTLYFDKTGELRGRGSTPHTKFASIDFGTVEKSLFQWICLS